MTIVLIIGRTIIIPTRPIRITSTYIKICAISVVQTQCRTKFNTTTLIGGWRMDIDVEGDNIETETFLTIEYEPLETDIPEPPVAE